jgi:acyl carrier protein
MNTTTITEELTAYVRREFLNDDPSAELTPTTPLLEWGILNSMSTARLIAYVHSRFEVAIPPRMIDANNFRDVRSVANLVAELS